MSNIILLFGCMVIGLALRRSGRLPDNSHVALSSFIIYISLPALTLLQIHNVRLQPALLYAVAMPWLLFLAGAIFFWSIAKAMRLTPQTTGALILTGGLATTAFFGLPLLAAFFGVCGLARGVLVDQLWTYLRTRTLVVTTAG